jgi:tRNA (guanine37-N1)-methyltransferase
MKFNIMTLFPEMFSNFISSSIIGRAVKQEILKFDIYNFRDYTQDPHGKVDDYVFGGGNGMLIGPQAIYDCYKDILKKSNKDKITTVYMSPRGKVLNQAMAKEFATLDEMVILCGHYEGVDERALKLINAVEVSIGDYVLTGGELSSMVMIDAISRNITGVLGNELSSDTDTFSNGLLEYPQYTRPRVYENLEVPEILLTGNHKLIEQWKIEQSLEITKMNRPDLYEKYKNRA